MAENKPTPAGIAYAFYKDKGFLSIGGDDKQILRFWRGDFYFWVEGVYRKIGKEELKAILVKYTKNLHVEPSTKIMENIKLNLSSLTILSGDRVPNTWITTSDATEPVNSVVTESGILTVVGDDVNIKPNTPDFFALGKVPYKYDSSAECPRWNVFLDEVTGENKSLQRMLQQWAGYLLVPTQKYQCFLLCYGEAATGKGTYARAMKSMLGQDNCSDVPLRRFVDKFSMYLTYGKKLNIAGDAEQELTPQVEAVIKTWTGKDGLDYERKFKDGFTAEATAKLMILANDFPTFTDKSMGTWRRLKIVPFTREDTNVLEHDLDERLREELPGILNWAIAGLRDLSEKHGFAMAEESKQVWEQFKEESNPAGIYLRSNYFFDHEYAFGCSPATVYAKYREWCKRNGYVAMSNKTFGKEIRRAFPKTEKRRMGGHGSRHYMYAGLKLSPGAEIRDY